MESEIWRMVIGTICGLLIVYWSRRSKERELQRHFFKVITQEFELYPDRSRNQEVTETLLRISNKFLKPEKTK